MNLRKKIMEEIDKEVINQKIHMSRAVFRESWISIKSNKLRSFLTTLGIIIGVCAVVIMVAAGQTVQNMINDSFAGMGSNILLIRPEVIATSGVKSGGQAVVRTNDSDIIKKLKYIKAVSPIVNGSAQIIYGNENYVASIVASTPDYLYTGKWEIEKGEPISDRDVKLAQSYILIGKTIESNIFPGGESAIGKSVRINNVPFVVKGVLKAKGQGMGGIDRDETVIMPVTTYRRRIRGSNIPNRVSYIMAQVDSDKNISKAKKYIENALRESRKIKPNAENDFSVADMTEMVETVKSVGTYLSILLASIASISLIVGSIGIMNMMLVSVTERTREIGIRKAIGAKNSYILYQFLLEAILISFIGSMVGMVLGISISQVVGVLLDKSVPVSMLTVIISFSVAIVVGIASGIFPALKATKLDPIEALRYQ